jgi:hypothetical protein
MDEFSPATTAESVVMAGETFTAPPPFPVNSMSNSLPLWTESDDMLDFLTSDFRCSWPVPLPVAQFEPSSIVNLDGSIPSPAENHGQGHQAMQQMSRLISVLSSNLTTEIQNTGITSSFLDTCMHVFFDKFNPSFPVLHRGTFVMKESSHPLLLNIMALGSLFVGARDAIPKGEALWRLAHIAVATNWKHLMATKGPRDSCEGVQLVLTAVLGQTYALMSKNESLRMTSQTFHGTIISPLEIETQLIITGLGFYWARQCGMFNIQKPSFIIPSLDAPEDEKTEAWKTWAALEVQHRSVLGHYLLDGHISHFSGYEACARHMTNPLHIPAPDAAFEASTVDEWIMQMQSGVPPSCSFRELFNQLFSRSLNEQVLVLSNFTLRILFEGLQSLVAELQQTHGQPAVGTPSKKDVAAALIRLYNTHLRTPKQNDVEQMELLLRWHSICLELAVPSTTLCRRLCADHSISQTLHDVGDSTSNVFNFREWSQSQDCLRGILHCMAIQEIVERLPLGRSHAIHLPAAIFAVSTVYSARCLAGFPTVTTPQAFSWERVWKVDADFTGNPRILDTDVETYLSGKLPKFGPNSCTKSLTYELNSLHIILLAVSSRWGVSHEMDSILNRWMTVINERNTGSVI